MNEATRLFGAIGAVSMTLAVALGAFGAHGLRARVAADLLDVWHTAVQYHVYHALGLFVVAGIAHVLPDAHGVRWAGWLMLLGVLFFSGSLYILVLTETRWLGAITPVGGVAFIAAWLTLAWSIWRS